MTKIEIQYTGGFFHLGIMVEYGKKKFKQYWSTLETKSTIHEKAKGFEMEVPPFREGAKTEKII